MLHEERLNRLRELDSEDLKQNFLTILEYNAGIAAQPQVLIDRLLGIETSKFTEEQTEGEMKEEIIAVLESLNGRPVSVNDLEIMCGVNPGSTRFRSVLKKLNSEQELN